MSKFQVLIVIALLLTLWIVANPRERFGYSAFGVTTYHAIPIPYFDLVVHQDGRLSFRPDRSHFISFNESSALFNESIDYLVIGTGYQDQVVLDPALSSLKTITVEALPTPQALQRFNQLKDAEQNVSAIIHSTC